MDGQFVTLSDIMLYFVLANDGKYCVDFIEDKNFAGPVTFEAGSRVGAFLCVNTVFRTTPLSTCHCCESCQLGIQTNTSSCNLYYRIGLISSTFLDRVDFKNGCTIGNACIDIVVYSCQFG